MSKFLKISRCQAKKTKNKKRSKLPLQRSENGSPWQHQGWARLSCFFSTGQERPAAALTHLHPHICTACWLLGTGESSSPTKGWYLKYLPTCSSPATAPSEQTRAGKGSLQEARDCGRRYPFNWWTCEVVQGSPKEGLDWWEQQGAWKDRCPPEEITPAYPAAELV